MLNIVSVDKLKTSMHKVGKKSKQIEGVLTDAQTRDKMHREIIAESMLKVTKETRWHALKIPTNKDLYWCMMLAKEGLCVALPEKKRFVLINGFVKKRRYRYSRPFAGYMFIGVNEGVDALYALYRLRLMWAIIGRAGRPMIFSANEISKLYQNLGCGEFYGLVENYDFDASIKKGDNVKSTSPAYYEQSFKVVEIKDMEAKVTGHFFGGICKMTVPLSSLKRSEE